MKTLTSYGQDDTTNEIGMHGLMSTGSSRAQAPMHRSAVFQKSWPTIIRKPRKHTASRWTAPSRAWTRRKTWQRRPCTNWPLAASSEPARSALAAEVQCREEPLGPTAHLREAQPARLPILDPILASLARAIQEAGLGRSVGDCRRTEVGRDFQVTRILFQVTQRPSD